ncbi:DUF4215 domain-containing protein, partial [Myxococcota bacterium]|nr:DUF4215 domain-containing protein [Myxococcota bacterium]
MSIEHWPPGRFGPTIPVRPWLQGSARAACLRPKEQLMKVYSRPLNLFLAMLFVAWFGLLSCDDDDSSSSVCGNSTVETGEECDDGNTTSGDGCAANCTWESTCGNNIVEGGEECDDGNTTDGDGCAADCTWESTCGNTIVEGGEECDDGNTTDGDGCAADCTWETTCGDGTKEGNEECDDGNTIDGDGCESDCTITVEVACKTMTPLASGVCEVIAGDDNKLLVGNVLTPTGILRGGEVLVNASGTITCVGCDCATEAAGATQVRCPSGVISPGLINSHDHITYVSNVPYTDTGERYEHRHDWRKGLNGHTKITGVSGGASADEIRYGELRFFIGGTTSVLGSGSASGFLRNLDRSEQEGLGQPPADYNTFPLGDNDGELLDDGCGYPSIDTTASVAGMEAYVPHVSEGINGYALNEFICVSDQANGGEDLLEPQSAFIHGVGLRPMQYGQMGVEGTALIWSPRTNITLYGDTAKVTVADRLGVLIAIGTDWIATGSMNMQRELKCADSYNANYLNGYFTDRDLWLMATLNGAMAISMDDAIGSITVGRVADIAIFDGSTNTDYRAVIDAQPNDVSLVMRGGEVLYGDDDLISTLVVSSCDAMDVCGTAKQ